MKNTITTLAWLTAPLWLCPLAKHLAYSPIPLVSWAGFYLLGVELIFALLLMIALIVLLVGPVMLFFHAYRRSALIWMGMAAVFFVSFVGGLYFSRMIQQYHLHRLVARSEPLVTAIHAYSTKHGRPPESLQQLVPDYIEEIPATGIGVFPEYHYITGEAGRYDGNPWVLLVTPPSPPMGFDSFMYFPMQNYPERGYGGRLERFGTWAYVHE